MPRCVITFQECSLLKPYEAACIFGRKWLALQVVATLDFALWERSVLGHGGSSRELNGLHQLAEGRSPPVFAHVLSTSYGGKRDPIGSVSYTHLRAHETD